jgi:hypothetical protein
MPVKIRLASYPYCVRGKEDYEMSMSKMIPTTWTSGCGSLRMSSGRSGGKLKQDVELIR